MALITFQNVSLAYDGKTAVSDLSFEIGAEDYLCIVGENGSGKSTLVAGLLGLKKPSAGTITLGGGLRQTDIGYLPQQSGIQKDFPAGVFEVVLSGCLNHGAFMPFYREREKRKALENMERLGVSDLRNHCYRELSGGQQQRVLLARTLCAAKKLLVLDEPVSGLDPVARSELYALIRMINRDLNMTVVMVSHDIRSSVENASNILHLDRKPLFYGTAADYIRSEAGRKFLGGTNNV